MSDSFAAAATHAALQPLVTAPDVQRFSAAVTVHDRGAFVAELDRLVREKVLAAVGAKVSAPSKQDLRRQAGRFRAEHDWAPSGTELQRGRAELLAEFELPHNLPLALFARLAHKSRQQVYKDIAAGRLLALDVGRRGRRLPEWQLQSVPLQLTQRVLAAAADVDSWTLYHALMSPTPGRGSVPAVAAVRAGNLDAVTRRVLNGLGIHEAERPLAAA